MQSNSMDVVRVALSTLLLTIIAGCSFALSSTPQIDGSASQTMVSIATPLAITLLPTLKPIPTFTPKNTRTLIPLVEATSQGKPAGTANPHMIIPKDLGKAEGIIQDVRSEIWANLNQVEAGDSHTINLYERPFTQKAMIYQGEVDIKSAEITSDANYFYVSIEVANTDQATNTLNAAYAVELDVDQDGRGEFIIWTFLPTSENWTTDSVSVFTDTNNDVGHQFPLNSEAPWKDGDGYDNEIFSPKYHTDPDLAWSRVSASNPRIVQIAFKRSIAVFKAFLWSVWADKDLHNSSQMEYNDYYTLEEAGSPNDDSAYFPLALLHSLDNTCRAPYGFNPTFKEPGICSPESMTEATPTQLPPSTQSSAQAPLEQTPTHGAPVDPVKPTNTVPALASGIISGCVYVDNDGNGVWNDNDTGWIYGGVSVDISGSGVSIGSDGCFSYTIDVGEYTVSLSHAGYSNSTPDRFNVTVSPGEAKTLFFGLAPLAK